MAKISQGRKALERIRELELRVKLLEQILEQLLEEQPAGPGPQAPAMAAKPAKAARGNRSTS